MVNYSHQGLRAQPLGPLTLVWICTARKAEVMRDTMVDTEVIKNAVQLACRAPSLHNSQPWHWVVADNTVQLYLDKDRVLYSTDHTGREALNAMTSSKVSVRSL